jgi:hypothetical protein
MGKEEREGEEDDWFYFLNGTHGKVKWKMLGESGPHLQGVIAFLFC